MSNLIDRDALLEVLKIDAEFDEKYANRLLGEGAKEIADIIRASYENAVKKMPTIDPVKWIPVSERLPEEDTDVLISYRYKEGEGDTSHVYIDITSYGDLYFGGRKVKGAKHWRPTFEYFTSNYEVIAWMPLPEPWRGEEDG